MISTRHLSNVPPINTLKQLTQSLAMLDAIIEPAWEYRYYMFNSNWAEGEQMASMDNSCGDNLYFVFGLPGAFIKGFDHESEMSPWAAESRRVWPGVLDDVPDNFKTFATEPAFQMEDTTFCIWHERDGKEWKTGRISYPEGDDPDGSGWMLAMFDGQPNTYREWAEGYYERPISLSAIVQVYKHEPLRPKLIQELNPAANVAAVAADARTIGYPNASV